MSSCRICKNNNVNLLLDFGKQPICNRFLKSTEQYENKYKLSLGLCNACGLVQLTDTFPAKELQPVYSWITYTEPEDHLDSVADILSKLPNISTNSSICGISFKDDSLLKRMKNKGFKNTARLDLKEDLKSETNYGGVETVQFLLDSSSARNIVARKGKFDIVIARHILEHAYDLNEFSKAIKELVKSSGYVLFEAPDCTKPLEMLDYSTVWEEHTVYFTPETFKNCFGFLGFKLERYKFFSYSLENCLVAIATPDKLKNTFPANVSRQNENNRAIKFSLEFDYKKNKLKTFFSGYKENDGNIALFGAGHAACMFINLLELKNYINCVIDDNPNKHGLLMPGSHLPIVSSSKLLDNNIKLCLFSLNAELEDKIISKSQIFTDNGGTFLSISPASKRSIYKQNEL